MSPPHEPYPSKEPGRLLTFPPTSLVAQPTRLTLTISPRGERKAVFLIVGEKIRNVLLLGAGFHEGACEPPLPATHEPYPSKEPGRRWPARMTPRSDGHLPLNLSVRPPTIHTRRKPGRLLTFPPKPLCPSSLQAIPARKPGRRRTSLLNPLRHHPTQFPYTAAVFPLLGEIIMYS